MMGDFCYLCNCAQLSDAPRDLQRNWSCPLVGKKICIIDCEIDLNGGVGAQDTLKQVMTLSGKTAWEVRKTCLACPHGGSKLDKPPELLSIPMKDGTRIRSGPEFEKAKRRDRKEWRARIERLKDPKYLMS